MRVMKFKRTKATVPVPLLADDVEVVLALVVVLTLVVVLAFVVLDAAVVLRAEGMFKKIEICYKLKTDILTPSVEYLWTKYSKPSPPC